jgi:hypothetical protein
VRTPAERSGPSGPWSSDCSSGRQSRDGGRPTNAIVPASEHAALSRSADAGDAIAITTAAISGPAVNSSSIATESSAYAAGTSSSRRRISCGHSVRKAPPMPGTVSPPTRPHATSATVGAPVSVSAISRPVAVASSSAAGSSTRRWPIRSIRRLCAGVPTAAPIANAPSTRPATAYESRASARYRIAASPYRPYGSRASIDASSSGVTCGIRRTAE